MATTGGEDRTAALKYWLFGTAAAWWGTGDLWVPVVGLAGFCAAVYLSKG